VPPRADGPQDRSSGAAGRLRTLASGVLSGLLAGAVALGVAELIAGITGPQGSPVVAVGGAAIDMTPIPVKDFAIAHFGSHDKTALITGILVLLAGFAAVIGVLALRWLAAMPSGSATSTDFGSGCASVPKSGAGSFSGMSTAPVATAASANPVLSTLVAAVKKAGLVDTLNAASNITVFAPANSAFAKIPSSTLNSVLANKAELTKILTYHVASARYTPADLASGKPIKTLEGATVTPAMMNGSYTVNGAQVVCGNVQTANATVYIISTVLMPKS
jgi:uncharacterized surface protein with fasciclin (FAS1) repeats